MSGGTGKDDEIMPEIFSFSIIFDASFISGLQQYFISSGYAKNSPAKFWEVDSDLLSLLLDFGINLEIMPS